MAVLLARYSSKLVKWFGNFKYGLGRSVIAWNE